MLVVTPSDEGSELCTLPFVLDPKTGECICIDSACSSIQSLENQNSSELSGCTPEDMEIVATTVGNGLDVSVSFPHVLLAEVVDSCGEAVQNATVVASVEGNTISMPPIDDGLYSASWVPLQVGTYAIDFLHSAAPHLACSEPGCLGFGEYRGGRHSAPGAFSERSCGGRRVHTTATVGAGRVHYSIWVTVGGGKPLCVADTVGKGTGGSAGKNWKRDCTIAFRWSRPGERTGTSGVRGWRGGFYRDQCHRAVNSTTELHDHTSLSRDFSAGIRFWCCSGRAVAVA